MSSTGTEDDLELLEEGLATTLPPATPDAAAGSRSMASSTHTDTSHVANSSRSNDTSDDASEQPRASMAPAAAMAAVAAITPSDGAGLELFDNDDEPPLPINMVEALLGTAKGSDHLPNRNNNTPPPSAATAPSFGPELVDDRDGLPLPIGTIEAVINAADDSEHQPNLTHATQPPAGVVEQVEDHDGPDPPAGTGSGSNSKKMAALGAKVESVDDVNAPAPFDSTDFEADENSKKMAALGAKVESVDDDNALAPFDSTEFEAGNDDAMKKTEKPAIIPSDEESPIAPTPEETEDEVGYATNRVEDEESPPLGTADRSINNNNDPGDSDGSRPDPITSRPDLDRDSTIRVPTAWAVNSDGNSESTEERVDVEVFIATHVEPTPPPLPLHKQTRVRLLLALVFLLAAALAVALGVSLSSERTVTAMATSSPPVIAPSTFPSAGTTTTPSTSLAPSYSPTACAYQVSSNAQKIDLQKDLQLDYALQRPKVDVDGMNMVVVAQEGDTGPVFVIFYALENDGWQRVNAPIRVDDLGGFYEVALSGTTAFVGFKEANDHAGIVVVYEHDQFGDSKKVEDPFIHDANASHDRFGSDVNIDGDLACVDDSSKSYLFRRESNKWVQFDMIDDGFGCSISGDNIAIKQYDLNQYFLQLYKYNKDLDGLVAIEEIIPTGYVSSMDLIHDYLVYWDRDQDDAFIYHREETNQTPVFLQQFNISRSEYNSLALDGDILVIGGDNTHIFSEINGDWEETITLDLPYDDYQLSGRSLLATKGNEVYAFNIEDCAQAMPTQTPSMSFAPTTSPSSSPTQIPSVSLLPTNFPSSSPSTIKSESPSMAPSSSFSPTETCYWIDIAVIYDARPWHTSWELQKVIDDDGGNNELVESFVGGQTSWGHTSHAKSICLQEGEYEFIISDPYGDGICCLHGEGHYNVTSSNGALIAEGGEFRSSETTAFSIPFVPTPPAV